MTTVPPRPTDREAHRLQADIRAMVRRFSLAERADVSCCGMTVAQAATLQALRAEDLRLGELARRLGIAASTLTRNLARLEERGLVRRVGDPEDRRASRVGLTEAGRRAAGEVERQEESFARAVLGELPPGSVEPTLAAFSGLLAAIRRATEACCPGAYDHLCPDPNEEDRMDNPESREKLALGDAEAVVSKVRERYAGFATTGSSCCGPARGGACCGTASVGAAALGYSTIDLDLLPEGADLGLGCGAPLRHLELQPGETVLDLGSGAGIDVLIAARRVGPGGRAIGVDMTPEMLAAARANAAAAGIANVEFRSGRLEELPLEDASVDAVTSNCVINLVPDKGAVFAEIARVLRRGGRLVVSDIVLDGELPPAVREDLLAWVGCVAGAERRERYFEMLAAAGLREVEVLADVDYLELSGRAAPDAVRGLLEGTGVDRDALAGVVRSITYRARTT
jgi:DNA-binding MarR family transcriptional regulator/SAM-dependent methyltransferase